MLGLPKTTEFNTRIPKQKFYENLNVTPEMKAFFVEQIKVIHWKNKIAATTINLAPGNDVTEIEVFQIKLNGNQLDESVLRQIDKEIPYHILFVLEYEGKYQARIGYKEAALSGSAAFKVNQYYHTDWLDMEALPIRLEGLNLDAVYENFVRQIAGDKLKETKAGETLKETFEREEEIQAIKKKIANLQAKMRKEKQLNKQMQINAELKSLKKELETL